MSTDFLVATERNEWRNAIRNADCKRANYEQGVCEKFTKTVMNAMNGGRWGAYLFINVCSILKIKLISKNVIFCAFIKNAPKHFDLVCIVIY